MDERLAEIVKRMHVHEENSVKAMLRRAKEGDIPNLIVLDPMFPGKKKNSLTNKKLQMIQQFERPCEDELGLLDAARALNPLKIVIKRPVKGPYLGEVKPAYSLQGKTIRYDCILRGNS
jgi:16S rRNA (guanine1516-N2)-methyltransferase